jgi:hypothetical protein
MSPGVSVAPSEAAERCTAAVAVGASEPAGRSGDRRFGAINEQIVLQQQRPEHWPRDDERQHHNVL